MIDALRRRADTHTSSSRLHDSDVERASFLGLPRPYGDLFLPAIGHDTNAANASSMVHTERGFLNCFFWCGQTGVPEDGKLEEEEDDLAVGMPDYLFGRRLGQGRQGEVRHAIQRSDGESVAIKCVKRHRHSVQEEENVLEEAAVLRRLTHTSVVRLLRFETLPSYHYLVLELLDGGEVLDAVAGLASYTEHDARQIAVAVLEALCHAHGDARRCVHRDLRPEHVLVSRDATASAKAGLGQRVKVAGWGRSKRLPQGGLVPGEHCFGNRSFVAPEMILEEEHGRPADMYAFGAILYTLLSGSPPRAATLATAITPTAPGTSGPAWGGVSPEAKALVRALMNPQGPAARVSAKEALEHEWIKAGEKTLRSRSLDAVLKGARVLSWRGAIMGGGREGGSVMGAIPRTVSMF